MKKKLIRNLKVGLTVFAFITILSGCVSPYAIYPKKDYSKIITNQLDYRFSKQNIPKPDYNQKEVKYKLEDFNKVFEGLMSTYYKPFSYQEVKRFALDGLKEIDITNNDAAKIIDEVSFAVLKHTDPYTKILSKAERKRSNTRLKSKSKAYGFTFRRTKDGLEILAINKKSKLNDYDIQIGDLITKLNQVSLLESDDPNQVFSWDILDADNALFTFLKKNGEEKVARIKKVYIMNETIDIFELFSKEGVNIFYIGISSFIRNTANDFKQRYKYLQTKNNDNQPFGLVIDLRGNPGGLLSSVTQICDFFISSGIFYKLVSLKHEFDYGAYYDDLDDGSVEIVVLIDGNSASSSEILTGCLYYQRNAVLIGEKSFGKSVAQVNIALNDGRALKITSGQGFTDLESLSFYPFIPDIQIGDDKSTKNDEVLEAALNKLFNMSKAAKDSEAK